MHRITKLLKLSLSIVLFVLISSFYSCSSKEEISVHAPDAAVQLLIHENEGKISYQLVWQNELVVDTSLVSILEDVPIKITKSEIKSMDSTWKPVWGQFSTMRDQYNELILHIEADGVKGKLFARVYNTGVGFRYQLDEVNNIKTATLYCEYNLANEDQLYFPAGEKEPVGPLDIKKLKSATTKTKFAIPIVVEKSNQKFISFLESDLIAAKGFKTMNVNFNTQKGVLFSSNQITVKDTELLSPWRVILLGENAGDLVINTVPLNLATPSKLENTDWIQPGKTVWDWRVHGYTTEDGFTYGINTESYKRFIDFAAKKGIEYFMIDADWNSKTSKGKFEVAKELDLQAVTDYASAKGVDLLLYYDRTKGNFGDDELFPYFNSLGMKGIKYGFMGNNVDFSRNAIQKSAAHNLLIDFHDSPVPFTGVSRTYPNAITREYCHAQQDYRKAFTPETFLKMALINAIQGPLDMNNGNFDLIGINRGDRKKGPKKTNSYISTVVSEVARTLVIFSGLVCIPDAPEAYEAKADLFAFIQKMPVGQWDETKILNASMGKYITTARRHGKEWFIGSVIDQKGGELKVDFDFLEEDTTYQVTFYEDTPETHGKTNPEAYQIRTRKLKKGAILKIVLAPGGGHCMWIRPV
ncbi:glycoside hydrolase family 97 protein [uncultured Polaribacter sp.]|uniref:glycoside hydrolase family 97 protein n=1 Tax=uncultured Polaribacter sp. TaxID=174711 RepID=UPI002609174B|nr:glycoside hydrolase family 97 protein [uncultured Polaribacter sp.]